VDIVAGRQNGASNDMTLRTNENEARRAPSILSDLQTPFMLSNSWAQFRV
jgi:hypothetical protein